MCVHGMHHSSFKVGIPSSYSLLEYSMTVAIQLHRRGDGLFYFTIELAMVASLRRE